MILSKIENVKPEQQLNSEQKADIIPSAQVSANALVGRSAGKRWMKLNSHGKYCLERFLGSISASDLLTRQLDYLYNKDLIGYALDFKDFKEREPLANHCLTDLGIETAKHYFPNYKYW